ncbi:T6SS effector amidase Tae4 family protein [Marinibactrum halimedae]|uniref:Type VI secretion system amidase effector protein Tae4 n=1 Tax=Marinibactrum halimedae TaxID=1444977 RepID=A0AA37T5Q6_9GAMM|nr:T6SS effector amidase Tae4 family protein [Marinibactrum halimedae]MCD9458449.1 type VI secretion system amidase effector protein Tae4 [Marinibactrum halimedae]GLS26146.1 hypothetical protein GCM10007877_18610 [Marinibactrum halimedae]
MQKVTFSTLWDNYPSDPCDTTKFKNQCAIKVGTALAKSGVDTTKLVSKKRHCWFHDTSHGHVLSAEELAAGLMKNKIPGISKGVEIDAMNFKAKVAGQKGIIFFKDYWLRSNDRENRPTGDHIDLWNGSRLTDLTSWIRIQMGIVYDGVWSDFEKSKKIIFWRVAD